MKNRWIQTLMVAMSTITFATADFAASSRYGDDFEAIVVTNRIFERLTTASNLHVAYRIQIYPSAEINAYSTQDGRLVVTRGLLQSVSEEKLAGAIAHEIGHLISSPKPKLSNFFTLMGEDEFKVDMLGIQILQNAGYDPASLAAILRDVLQKDGKLYSRVQVRQLVDRIRLIEKKVGHCLPGSAMAPAAGD